MKITIAVVLGLFVLGSGIAAAADADAPPANWKQILQEMQRRQDALEKKIESQQKRIEELERERARSVTPPAAPADLSSVRRDAFSPAQPLPLARQDAAYLNLSLISNVTVGASSDRKPSRWLQLGHHDPKVRGFNVTGTELVFDGAVDPYFRGFANIGFATDSDGGTEVELEEAYLQTTSLPANLQLRAGQFYAEFGRQNPQHPHFWSFVDQPIILNRLFGPDGLRNPGARLSWLAPTPFYTELTFGVFNSSGGTAYSFLGGGHSHSHGHDDEEHAFSPIHGGEPVERSVRSMSDMLYVPRLATSFNPTETQTLLLGASVAFGPNNSGSRAKTQIFGLDTYWKWQPVNAQRGFPFVSWQSEALWRRYNAADRWHPHHHDGHDHDSDDEDDEDNHDDHEGIFLVAERLRDWGFYSQVLWGFRPGWVLGLRGEYASSNDGAFFSILRTDRTRISPNLTWFPTEFSKIRLQYNYDRIQRWKEEHTVWLQFEFTLGAHGAHKF